VEFFTLEASFNLNLTEIEEEIERLAASLESSAVDQARLKQLKSELEK
jgi:hypothetical protein